MNSITSGFSSYNDSHTDNVLVKKGPQALVLSCILLVLHLHFNHDKSSKHEDDRWEQKELF